MPPCFFPLLRPFPLQQLEYLDASCSHYFEILRTCDSILSPQKF